MLDRLFHNNKSESKKHGPAEEIATSPADLTLPAPAAAAAASPRSAATATASTVDTNGDRIEPAPPDAAQQDATVTTQPPRRRRSSVLNTLLRRRSAATDQGHNVKDGAEGDANKVNHSPSPNPNLGPPEQDVVVTAGEEPKHRFWHGITGTGEGKEKATTTQ
ncbi:hypothetical protein AYL99_10847 [Fonsecaea erecta]|uniref:Uncharacterized protein n=1 Tax=Fonsecaea erecta TaxID=1367422 RepID=A0A178Z5W2_9EURO|nr:hypothetical protein AYL99_10847 [Fonsecaea erecta]OAP55147.1 hypothetical protein AYL99_10847 [Fonsecaea erecta]